MQIDLSWVESRLELAAHAPGVLVVVPWEAGVCGGGETVDA